ncbi:MAG: DedA family protein, partial [Holosporales bacterium]
MPEFLHELLEHLGYFELFLLMFLENLFPPIPSELIMPLAGYQVAQGTMQFWPAVAAGLAGSVLGQTFWYAAARLYGRERFYQAVDRFGRFLGVHSRDLEPADRWFTRHGAAVVFFGRLLPAVRTLISVPAGIVAMPFGRFLLLSACGSGIWVIFLTVLGQFFGENYGEIADAMAPFSKIIVGGIAVVAVLWLIIRKRAKKKL